MSELEAQSGLGSLVDWGGKFAGALGTGAVMAFASGYVYKSFLYSHFNAEWALHGQSLEFFIRAGLPITAFWGLGLLLSAFAFKRATDAFNLGRLVLFWTGFIVIVAQGLFAGLMNVGGGSVIPESLYMISTGFAAGAFGVAAIMSIGEDKRRLIPITQFIASILVPVFLYGWATAYGEAWSLKYKDSNTPLVYSDAGKLQGALVDFVGDKYLVFTDDNSDMKVLLIQSSGFRVETALKKIKYL